MVNLLLGIVSVGVLLESLNMKCCIWPMYMIVSSSVSWMLECTTNYHDVTTTINIVPGGKKVSVLRWHS